MRQKQIDKIKQDNIRMQRDNFWSLNPVPLWLDYPVLKLENKTDFYRSPFRFNNRFQVPLFKRIDWFKYRTPIMPDEPDYLPGEDKEYRTVTATRDARIVSLMAMQVIGYQTFETASLAQLNSMLTHVYRYAIRAQKQSNWYSIGYMWKRLEPWTTHDMLTVGGHSKRPKCFCPVPVIASGLPNGAIVLTFYSILNLSDWQWTSEPLVPLAHAGMDVNGIIRTWQWETI